MFRRRLMYCIVNMLSLRSWLARRVQDSLPYDGRSARKLCRPWKWCVRQIFCLSTFSLWQTRYGVWWTVKNYAVFHCNMKRSDNIEEVRRAAYFQEDLEKPRFSPGQRWGQWMRCTVTVSVPYSFRVIFLWRISCQLLIVWHGSHTVTLDNLSLQALGDAPGKLDQGVFQRFWGVRYLDSCCNLSCPSRFCWG